MRNYRRYRPGAVFIEAEAEGSPLALRLASQFADVRHVERYVPVRYGADDPRGARSLKSDLVVRRQPRIFLEHFGNDQDVSFDLAWGCPLHCSYCTLLHRLPRHPYIAVYSNVEEILAAVDRFVEGATDPVLIVGDTTDCLALEPLTGSLRQVIEHFGRLGGRARLEFLTKSGEVGSILDADHRGFTSVGYSLNTPRVIAAVEHATAPLATRLEGLRSALEAGYSLFVDVAPMFAYPGWQDEYRDLLFELHRALTGSSCYDPSRLRLEAEVHWQKESEWPLNRRLYPRSDFGLLTASKEEVEFAEGRLSRYPLALHAEMEGLFHEEVGRLFPGVASARFCPPADPADQGTTIPA